jgi:hypothetical protein
VYRALRPAINARGALRYRRAIGHAICCTTLLSAYSQPPRPVTQSDVEAVYLYNFGKFVNWPPDAAPPSGPFSICTLGADDFNGALDAITSNESLQGHKIAVRHLTSIANADGCHILFIGSSEEARLNKDLSALRVKPVLTVSNMPSFLDRGGMIQFIVRDKRVRFAVNLTTAVQAHLSVSSELLKVAVAVQGAPPEGIK